MEEAEKRVDGINKAYRHPNDHTTSLVLRSTIVEAEIIFRWKFRITIKRIEKVDLFVG